MGVRGSEVETGEIIIDLLSNENWLQQLRSDAGHAGSTARSRDCGACLESRSTSHALECRRSQTVY